jgi:8-oxo-dGTP pyrophosphatase MutT (NUDIX family)
MNGLNRMNLYCNNCGNKGHLYRGCRYPVMSYGIMCFTKDKKILMIQRKDSLNYIEFLRGKYKLIDQKYILDLLEGCSVSERDRLYNDSFDTLWSNLWFSGPHKKPQTERMIKEYHKSKKLFNSIDIKGILSKCKKNYKTPEWEIPKGRRSNKESNIDCAIREFEEETDLDGSQYILFKNVLPINEEYRGNNGINYKHIYYFALYNGNRELSINKDKYEQYTEISDIRWFTIEDSLKIIRDEHPTKKMIINKTKLFIDTWNKDYFLNDKLEEEK